MQTEEKPFKIGLALGGGAMRGLAHIGAMQVMEEHGIMPDVVAGTSIGAFVGGVYACGMSLKMMERFCYSINEKDLMDVVRPRQGLIGGARIERMLRTLTGNRTFDQARIPFAAVATELERGERFVFQEGPIWEGVRASISIPGIFVPFHTGGHTYVDGGVVDRVPIAAARELGADFVIGVDVGLPRRRIALRRPVQDHPALDGDHGMAGHAAQGGERAISCSRRACWRSTPPPWRRPKPASGSAGRRCSAACRSFRKPLKRKKPCLLLGRNKKLPHISVNFGRCAAAFL